MTKGTGKVIVESEKNRILDILENAGYGHQKAIADALFGVGVNYKSAHCTQTALNRILLGKGPVNRKIAQGLCTLLPENVELREILDYDGGILEPGALSSKGIVRDGLERTLDAMYHTYKTRISGLSTADMALEIERFEMYLSCSPEDTTE